MNRRDFLGLAGFTPSLAQALVDQRFQRSPAAAIGSDGARLDSVEVVRDWNGSFCRPRLVNRGACCRARQGVILFDVDLSLPPATDLYASGGLVLSGDDLTKLPPARAAMLAEAAAADRRRRGVRRCLAARRDGRPLPGARMMCLFNWDDRPQTLSFRLPSRRPSPTTGPDVTEHHGRRQGRSCRSRWRRDRRAAEGGLVIVPSSTIRRHAVDRHGICRAFSVVGLALYGLPLYYDFMVREFGWSRTMVTSGNAISKLVVGPLFGFAAGWIVDRFGPRRLMMAGILMAGGALVGLGAISAAWMFYFFYFFNALGYVCGGPLPNQVLLSRWFDRTRGRAMGIAYLGIGIGGAVVPLLAPWLTDAFGWRGSLQALGVLIISDRVSAGATSCAKRRRCRRLAPAARPAAAATRRREQRRICGRS